METLPIKSSDMATAIADQFPFLERAGRLGEAKSSHAQQVRAGTGGEPHI